MGAVILKTGCAILGFSLMLVGCSTVPDAAIETAKSAFRLGSGKGEGKLAELDSRYRYLRLTAMGNLTFPVLGFVDGDTEVWYTGAREVIRMKTGRLFTTAGLPTNWLDVSHDSLPDWPAKGEQAASYSRSRTVMPGYRVAVLDTVTLRSISAPQRSSLVGREAQTLAWFEESATTNDQQSALPRARFAVDMAAKPPKVIYSEQCLSMLLCLHMQEWSASEQSRFNEKAN